MKARKISPKDERLWKLMALESEYDPETGVEDEYWDKNFTKNMIRNDIMWLIKEIYKLEKKLKFVKSTKKRRKS